MDSQTNREGVTTTYTYDAARRQVASTRLGITTTNFLDAAGRVLRATRIGTDASQIRLSSATYGTDGSLATETNALNGVTFMHAAPTPRARPSSPTRIPTAACGWRRIIRTARCSV